MPDNTDNLTVSLFSVQSTLPHIKKPIIPLLYLFHLDEEMKSPNFNTTTY